MDSRLLLVHAYSQRIMAARPKHAGDYRPRLPLITASVPSIRGKKHVLEKKDEEILATEYRDNWFDRLAANHLSRSLQDTTGIRNKKKGYESLVEAASSVAMNFGHLEQEQLVIGSLNKAFPQFILKWIKNTMPQTKFTRESFAFFTTVIFSWLIGPCEVKESEFQGDMEKNVVHIKKCRFLEATNCVGMCTHMCKIPSQKFIKESLGMPVNMVPNFDDMSCEMIFGEEPPLPTDDPALKQPCYKTICKAKLSHNMSCTKK